MQHCIPPFPNKHRSCCFLLVALGFIPALSWANEAPQLKNSAKTLKEDATAIITLTGKDPERKPLSFTIAQPAHGAAALKGLKVRYTPAANYNGADSFQYTANDGELSATATVNLTIQPVNDLPVAMSQDTTVSTGIATAITLSASDVDGDSLSYRISVKPKKGSIALSGNIVTYTSKTSFTGADSFAFKAKDKKITSKSALVQLNVGAVAINCTPPQVLINSTCQTPSVNFSVTKTGTGRGVVSSNPPGLDCGATCSGSFAVGTFMTLTATPDATSTFTGWTEACAGTTPACTVTLNVTDTVVANFNAKSAEGTGKLNDTGITTCSDNDGERPGLACPLASHPGQDAQFGRDVTHNDNSDGHAGFSFTKISSTGEVLVANATAWNCVKDNVTGLMWEEKTDDGKLHDMGWTYTWYQPDNSKNGGEAGIQASGSTVKCGNTLNFCNTAAYVAAVNAASWCGFKDWRMPTVGELFGIAALDRTNPAIDTAYFPNTLPADFLSSSPSPGYVYWSVGFDYGRMYPGYNSQDGGKHVRLVRSGQ